MCVCVYSYEIEYLAFVHYSVFKIEAVVSIQKESARHESTVETKLNEFEQILKTFRYFFLRECDSENPLW